MANTVKANWYCYVAGSATNDPRIGVNGEKNNIMCYKFTTGASGASHLYHEMGYTRHAYGGYTDICWYVGTSSTSHTNANKAQGSASNGTVTFDGNHHSFVVDADINLLPNTTYYLWYFPAVTEYGWYYGSRADTDNTLTLSGATKYTVSYNANGGTGAPSAQTKSHGTALTLSSTKPTKATTTDATYKVTFNANGGSCSTSSLSTTKTSKYTFSKWNTASNGSGTSYNSGASYTNNAAVTLYAQYTQSTSTASINLPTATKGNSSVTGYKVTFNANGGSCSTSNLTSTRTVSYAFKGWSTNSSATSGSTGAYTPTASTTLYATWATSYTNNAITLPTATRSNGSVEGYKVTFNANGGTCSTKELTSTRTTSYTFKGWSTSSSATSGSTSSYTPTAATTLYATWETGYTNNSITLPTPTRSGYTFLGWATSSTATSGTVGSYTPTKAVTLYAIWEADGLVYIDDGTGWNAYMVYIDNGESWDLYIPYIDNGESWDLLS